MNVHSLIAAQGGGLLEEHSGADCTSAASHSFKFTVLKIFKATCLDICGCRNGPTALAELGSHYRYKGQPYHSRCKPWDISLIIPWAVTPNAVENIIMMLNPWLLYCDTEEKNSLLSLELWWWLGWFSMEVFCYLCGCARNRGNRAERWHFLTVVHHSYEHADLVVTRKSWPIIPAQKGPSCGAPWKRYLWQTTDAAYFTGARNLRKVRPW